MIPEHHRNALPAHDELHPLVYRTMVGLVVWLVISIWAFFDRGAYISLILAMITMFFVIVVGIPMLIWVTWRRNTSAIGERSDSLGAWLAQEFRTWTGVISGSEAALQILLPLVAVSIGMTIFGLVFYLDATRGGY